ncbi:unnamed protein product [Didymodactylos carnosus]|uniref:30S ribosomal protein S2 n=1 Tax=Didymodactylos carnosus TaxID=1234261 RepID=A0A8S2CLP3_9BILA|nr:unnamed protein product [Didymodactylos carnosus]CAF3492013.1 unnamed protein product [Didymodactylos carnosus]
MRPYIKGRKGSAHIFHLEKIQKVIELAYQLIYDVTQKGGKLLFVGTKGALVKQLVKEQAERAHASYVTQRALDKSGEIAKYSKKEQINIQKEIEKLLKFLGGISNMKRMPDVMVIVDPKAEMNPVLEAKKLGIATIGITNSNGAPDDTDITIPANTVSSRTVQLLLQIMADAAAEALGEPTFVMGKRDEEIILAEEKKIYPETVARTGHKSFSRFAKPRFPRQFTAPTPPSPTAVPVKATAV